MYVCFSKWVRLRVCMAHNWDEAEPDDGGIRQGLASMLSKTSLDKNGSTLKSVLDD